MLGPDGAVVEALGFFLGQDDDAPGALCKPLKHCDDVPLSARSKVRLQRRCPDHFAMRRCQAAEARLTLRSLPRRGALPLGHPETPVFEFSSYSTVENGV